MAKKLFIGGAAGSTTLWGAAANWNPANKPVTNDMVIIPRTTAYGISDTAAASTAVYASVTFEKGYSEDVATVGTPLVLTMSTAAGSGVVELGGTGEQYLQVDEYSEIRVNKAGPAPDVERCALNIVGEVSSAGDIYVDCASNETVGLSHAATSATAYFHAYDIKVRGGVVRLGPLVTEEDSSTAPELTVEGGEVHCKAPIGVLTQEGGICEMQASATVTSPTIRGGTYQHNSDGTITTLVVGGTGFFDLSKDTRPVTITSANVHGAGSINDPHGRATWTNGVDLEQRGIPAGKIDLGENIHLDVSAL